MVDDHESVRKALDQVESVRRRAQVIAGLAMLAVVGTIAWFRNVVATTDNLEVIVEHAVQLLIVTILATGFMVVFWMTHLTRRILRAIQALAGTRGTSKAE
jgi:hypothetical protein